MSVQGSTGWSIRATGSLSLCDLMINPQMVDVCDQINEISFNCGCFRVTMNKSYMAGSTNHYIHPN